MKRLITRPLCMGLFMLVSVTLPASADATSDCDRLIETAKKQNDAESEKAIACYKTALALSKHIEPAKKAEAKWLSISELLTKRYRLLDRWTESEKLDRQMIAICEKDKIENGGRLSSFYHDLAEDLKFEGRDEEAELYSKKSFSAYADYRAAIAKKNEDDEFKRKLSDYNSAIKQTGENSEQSFLAERQLAQFYITHNFPDKARPIVVKMVTYARDSKHYFDSGAEWDKRRMRGEPTEGSEKTKINGKECTVFIIDNRRPCGIFSRSDLVRFLYVISSIDKKLGQSELASAEMKESKEQYSK